MKNKISSFVLALFFSISCVTSNAQVIISGPTCALPGVVYHYRIIGLSKQTVAMKICVTGGVIADKNASAICTPEGGAPLSSVLIKWNKVSAASLVLTSAQGTTSLNVTITEALHPGTIDSLVKNQFININTVPAPIVCSIVNGGTCNPSFSYQWQQSDNIVKWKDIIGASAKDLVITIPLKQTTYYRRKVTEMVSGSIAYSEVAAVFVE